MKKLLSVLVLSTLWLGQFTTVAAAQGTGHKIITKTRLPMVFGDLENQWLKAVQQKDTATLNRLLDEDFQTWTPAGNPIPRADWQKAAFDRPLQSFRLSQLAARGVTLDISVAAFRLSQTFGTADQSQTEDYFVMDVWLKGEGDNWKCTDRYLWRVSDTAQPGGTKEDVKPTGKE